MAEYSGKMSETFCRTALNMADKEKGKPTDVERNRIHGLSTIRTRCLISNLCAKTNTNYLEIGVYKGSTIIAAMFDNLSTKVVGVDHFKYDEREAANYQFTIDMGFGSYPEEVRFQIVEILLNDEGNVDTLDVVYPVDGGIDPNSIVGLDGLEPTLKIIKKTKKIAIANKESIICGWNLINKELKKNKTKFIPVDSEHFSIWSLVKNYNYKFIDKIYITASGGPFLKWPNKKLKKVTPEKALKHPNWSMGKKISIDSATMMNKVFEVIETQRIFNLEKSKIKILIHDKSYIHAIVQFKNGLKKILVHDTNMEIPIFNTLYDSINETKFLKSRNLDIGKLNNLDLKSLDKKKFPLIKILDKMSNKSSLLETVLISANDELVNLFLKKKISYIGLQKNLLRILNLPEFKAFRKKIPKNINEINKLNNYVRLKIKELCI